jgi:hypothetical protein
MDDPNGLIKVLKTQLTIEEPQQKSQDGGKFFRGIIFIEVGGADVKHFILL